MFTKIMRGLGLAPARPQDYPDNTAPMLQNKSHHVRAITKLRSKRPRTHSYWLKYLTRTFF